MNSTNTENADELICKNCGEQPVKNFCPNCGQKTYRNRFTTRSFLLKFIDAFDIDKGFFYVLKMLIKKPGKVINEYLSGRTKIYFNPLKFFIIIAGFSSILMIWLNVYDDNLKSANELLGVEKVQEENHMQDVLNSYIKQYMNIIFLLMLPFVSLASKWYFYKEKLYYGEHLIINCFLIGELTVFSLFLLPIYVFSPSLSTNMFISGALITIFYYTYSIKSIFKKSILKSILGAIAVNVLGYFLFSFFLIISMLIVVLVLKLGGYNIS